MLLMQYLHGLKIKPSINSRLQILNATAECPHVQKQKILPSVDPLARPKAKGRILAKLKHGHACNTKHLRLVLRVGGDCLCYPPGVGVSEGTRPECISSPHQAEQIYRVNGCGSVLFCCSARARRVGSLEWRLE